MGQTKKTTLAAWKLKMGHGELAFIGSWGEPILSMKSLDNRKKGEHCPFGQGHFQLMRNFIFAATAAGNARRFAVMIIVPSKTAAKVKEQVNRFRGEVLKEEYRDRVSLDSYLAIL
jgi:hypothetical protein